MATAEQLKALIDSFRKSDDARFRTVALQIAALSAKQGKGKLAEELRAMLEQIPRQHSGPVVPLARAPRNLSGLLEANYPSTRLSEMVLSDTLRNHLERVVVEYRQRERIRAHGFRGKQRLLLTGPPGCGKTMTAAALAGECHLPLMVVQLHSLITRYMGETASQLHQVFEAIERTPGIYLFDEFDAIGAIRASQNDVGEIRRVLNSFLQFLENVNSNSIIVAATNLVELLDPALFRRFDSVLTYTPPDDAMIQELIRNRLGPFGHEALDWRNIVREARGLSHADVVRAAEESAKQAILNERPKADSTVLLSELKARRDLAQLR